MNKDGTIILCQPDSSKGCSVCCGLFNYLSISESDLCRILENAPGSISPGDWFDKKPRDHQSDIRDITTHICRYQGFIAGNRPGCTLHPLVLGSDNRDISLYGSRICQEYLCPAHEILGTEHKTTLISYVNHWYEYCIAIIDPETFIWMYDIACSKLENEPPVRKDILLENFFLKALAFHGNMLGKTKTPLFHYSLAEYNQYKSSFTISGCEEEQAVMREILEGTIKSSVS